MFSCVVLSTLKYAEKRNQTRQKFKVVVVEVSKLVLDLSYYIIHIIIAPFSLLG